MRKMSKKYTNPLYKRGDYITGIDRSYPRSIYIYKGMNIRQTKVIFEFISLNKRSGVHWASEKDREQRFPAKIATEYRKATREELLEEGVIPQSIDFIKEK